MSHRTRADEVLVTRVTPRKVTHVKVDLHKQNAHNAASMLLDTGAEGWVLVGQFTLHQYLMLLKKYSISMEIKNLENSNTEYAFGVGSVKTKKTVAIPFLHPSTNVMIYLEVDVIPGRLPFVCGFDFARFLGCCRVAAPIPSTSG